MTSTRLIRFALVAAAVLPAVVSAQRPGMSSLGQRPSRGLQREPGIEAPATINIVNLVLEHRQDLFLTDTQFRRVVVVKRALDSTNAPLVRRIDSVQRLFKGVLIFTNPTPAHRDSLNAGKAVVNEMAADIDDNIADAKDKLFLILSTPQKERAEQIEDKARQQASASAGRGRL
ncbi:MAG: hypothetical protein ACREPM_20855 [Gemmatimonadaceae bacterium]